MRPGSTLVIRPCHAGDLVALEWDGLYGHHRELITRTYREQLAGLQVMLVGELDARLVGQAWIDLRRGATRDAAMVWAVRVHPDFRDRGLGTELMIAAEAVIRQHARAASELTVERTNTAARRFYERLGYRVTGPAWGSYSYTTPDGARHDNRLDLFLMRKELR